MVLAVTPTLAITLVITITTITKCKCGSIKGLFVFVTRRCYVVCPMDPNAILFLVTVVAMVDVVVVAMVIVMRVEKWGVSLLATAV